MADTLSPTFLCALSLFFLTDAQAKSVHPDYQLLRGEVQQYGDWLVGCDNQAACTLLGFPSPLLARENDPNIFDMAVQISLSGAVTDPPVVEILPFNATTARLVQRSTAHPYFLNVEYDVSALSPPHGFSRHSLSPLEADAVVRHLGAGKVLSGKTLSNDTVHVRFPHNEFVRAYRAMQSRRAQLLQQRADQAIDALPGELPDGSTMPVAGKHRRRLAKEVMVSGFAPIFANKNCAVSIMRDMRRYIFSGGAELWSYGCDDGLANQSYWQMAPTAMALAAPLDLPEPRDGGVRAGTQGLENAIFDWDFGILRSYQYQPGRADCGTFRAWGYTDNGWQLLERREMPLCKGIQSSDWIRTHYTPTDGPGPDE